MLEQQRLARMRARADREGPGTKQSVLLDKVEFVDQRSAYNHISEARGDHLVCA